MKIIIGLGNIGEKYVKTRHNIGFLVLDEFVRQLEKEGAEVSWKEEAKLSAITAKITYKDEKVLLVKPTTLMNNSGRSAQQILSFFKESPENMIVVYDDIDLPLGTVRFREKGSAGTHNGMRSIIQEVGTEDFPRLRLGIESRGDIAPQHQDLSSFVLSNFTESEYELLIQEVKEAVEHLKKLNN